MKDLEDAFKNMHRLDRAERLNLERELRKWRPEFYKPYLPKWYWWKRCRVNVLVVADGGLNYDTGGFGLTEFLTTFNELEAKRWWVDYRVTLAHRGPITTTTNPVVVSHLSNFKFDTSVTLNNFDQVWLFGILASGGIDANEKNAIANYMDGGGGLFATGDHGALGNSMCGDIIRVRDMRHWTDTPNSADDTNEVSMGGRRRNDTNVPRAGNATATTFDHQSDSIPQRIGVRKFGTGFLPHPLLSISPTIIASGVIDIMPDHPHEGECKRETSFTVNGFTVPTQTIATNYVTGGNTSGSKDATDPHCFPSIAVWDGRLANAGRIVVDSTWHHFVNINLNGSGSSLGGLNPGDFYVIQQYYMNIATWMTRRKITLCWRWHVVFDLLVNSQLIEASLNNPIQDKKDISLADLKSIGGLAEEILATSFNPSFARDFLLELIEDYHGQLAATLDIWRPEQKVEVSKATNEYHHPWINLDLALHTMIGAGFISLRDNSKIASDDSDEKDLAGMEKAFNEGIAFGFKAAMQNLDAKIESAMKNLRLK